MFGLKRNPRKIFGPYNDGQRAVYGDPAELHARLMSKLGGDPDKVTQQMQSPDAELSYQAWRQWLDAVIFAFEVKPFDKATGQGMQRDDIVALGNSFAEYLKKNGQPPGGSPTGSAPTTSSPGDSAMPNLSGCGCS